MPSMDKRLLANGSLTRVRLLVVNSDHHCGRSNGAGPSYACAGHAGRSK